ncbi:zinc-ribbon domain-containing protein [Desulfonauticus submarinus]
MIVKCNNCDKKITIPDEKIKGVSKFVVKCPKCGSRILVDKAKIDADPETERALSSKVNLDYEPDNVPLGKKSAFLFVFDPRLSIEIEDFLQNQGYFIRNVQKIEEALARFALNNYTLMFLEESKDTDRLLAEINKWPLLRRRETNVILLGETGRDFDQKLAFLKGVNFYLNKKSGELLLKIKQCLDEYESYLTCWKRNEKGT